MRCVTSVVLRARRSFWAANNLLAGDIPDLSGSTALQCVSCVCLYTRVVCSHCVCPSQDAERPQQLADVFAGLVQQHGGCDVHRLVSELSGGRLAAVVGKSGQPTVRAPLLPLSVCTAAVCHDACVCVNAQDVPDPQQLLPGCGARVAHQPVHEPHDTQRRDTRDGRVIQLPALPLQLRVTGSAALILFVRKWWWSWWRRQPWQLFLWWQQRHRRPELLHVDWGWGGAVVSPHLHDRLNPCG